MARNKNKLVFGKGINDLNYEVTKYEVIDGKSRVVWECPYYLDWQSILRRCFDPKFQERRPTYKGCTIHPDWIYASKFVEWVDSQPNKDWRNCQPDKDLLLDGNKHYSPDTVVYISKSLNCFLTDRGKDRGKYMLGVTCNFNSSKTNPYMSRCNDIFKNKSVYLGRFSSEIDAHKAWQDYKHHLSCKLSEEQDDIRVVKALQQRYSPEKDWTKR